MGKKIVSLGFLHIHLLLPYAVREMLQKAGFVAVIDFLINSCQCDSKE